MCDVFQKLDAFECKNGPDGEWFDITHNKDSDFHQNKYKPWGEKQAQEFCKTWAKNSGITDISKYVRKMSGVQFTETPGICRGKDRWGDEESLYGGHCQKEFVSDILDEKRKNVNTEQTKYNSNRAYRKWIIDSKNSQIEEKQTQIYNNNSQIEEIQTQIDENESNNNTQLESQKQLLSDENNQLVNQIEVLGEENEQFKKQKRNDLEEAIKDFDTTNQNEITNNKNECKQKCKNTKGCEAFEFRQSNTKDETKNTCTLFFKDSDEPTNCPDGYSSKNGTPEYKSHFHPDYTGIYSETQPHATCNTKINDDKKAIDTDGSCRGIGSSNKGESSIHGGVCILDKSNIQECTKDCKTTTGCKAIDFSGNKCTLYFKDRSRPTNCPDGYTAYDSFKARQKIGDPDCPSDFPYRTQLSAHKNVNYKYCYNNILCTLDQTRKDADLKHQCGRKSWVMHPPSLLDSGCPSDFPYRTQLSAHKNDNYKYCYNRKECAKGDSTCPSKDWVARNNSTVSNQCQINDYTGFKNRSATCRTNIPDTFLTTSESKTDCPMQTFKWNNEKNAWEGANKTHYLTPQNGKLYCSKSPGTTSGNVTYDENDTNVCYHNELYDEYCTNNMTKCAGWKHYGRRWFKTAEE